MADPWVPPYFGSWQDLVAYVLSHPLGSMPPHIRHAHRTAFDPEPSPWRFRGPQPDPWVLGPSPDPWRWVVSALVSAVNAKSLAQTVEGAARQQIEASANRAIAQILDDYCGTPPKVWPWPWPGPPPWVFTIASELNAIANAMEAGTLREGLVEVAGQVLQRGMATARAET